MAFSTLALEDGSGAEPPCGEYFSSSRCSTENDETGFSFDQLGAEADKKGVAVGSFTATSSGALLKAQLQDLDAKATSGGLWLTSTAEEDAGVPNRLRVKATKIGRPSDSATLHVISDLPSQGTVMVGQESVVWQRPGLIEEYRVNSDGVRQDFVVIRRPEGAGDELAVELELDGARAEAADYGVKLTVDETGRELAYSRLRVIDASGRDLKARMEVAALDRLRVVVQDSGASYPVRIDPTFSDADWVALNSGIPGANNSVNALAVDASGNLYAGGVFTAIGTIKANYIAKWNGSSWSALGTGMNNNGYVSTLAVMGNDLYAGGSFTVAGGVPANRLAKWDGSAWSALGSGVTDGFVDVLAVVGSDLYVGGFFSSVGGTAANCIAKWNGSAWSALGSGISGTSFPHVYSLEVIGSDLYAGGIFTTAGGVSASRIAKWNGSAWSSLGTGMSGAFGDTTTVWSLEVIGSDLYAGGNFITAGGTTVNRIAKWNGSAWSSLGSGMSGSVTALVAIGSDLYAGGGFSTAGGTSAIGIAKWDGASWSALASGMGADGGANGGVSELVVIGSDLYAAGDFNTAGGIGAERIAKWNGSAWSALGSGIGDTVYELLVSGDNLYAAGSFTTAGATTVNRIAKWDGSSWSALGSGMNSFVYALAVIGSDLYAGGDFTTAGGTTVNRIAKWDGSAWSALGSGINGGVYALAVIGSDVYAGGNFTLAGGATANRIAKWDGSVWSALGTGMSDYVNDLAASGTNLYAGGYFTTAGGTTVNRIARWNGSAWSGLGSGMNDTVNALAVIGSDVYAGGAFTTASGTGANRIAKWNGSTWSALGSGMNISVRELAVIGSDLYAGGAFTTAGGIGANRIAKWNGSVWSALGSGVDNEVFALTADTSGHVFVGGWFLTAGTTFSPFIAQANVEVVTPIVTSPTVTAIDEDSASLGGSVDVNGQTITERGVVVAANATNSNPAIGGLGVTKSTTSGTAGVFALSVGGLTEGTTYAFKAFATSAAGSGYSAVGRFTTDTILNFLSGVGSVTGRQILAGDTHVFKFNLSGAREAIFTGTGAANMTWELRNGSNTIVGSGTGNISFSDVIVGGNYSLRLSNTGGSSETVSLNLDASTETQAKPKPDISIGLTATATTGIDVYSPAVQSALATSKRAVPKSFHARIDNDGPLSDTMKVQGSVGTSLFAVNYTGPGGNITAQVVAGTFTTVSIDEDEGAVAISMAVTPNKAKIRKRVRKGKRFVYTYLRKTYAGFIKTTAGSDATLSDTAAFQVKTTP